MLKVEKEKVLLAVAQAYYDRGVYCQYDQRSMDRVLELTPRRRKRLPPEAGNSQHTLFLDCSGYVTAIYLNAFGYELPSDLTWHMVDHVGPRVYYYEVTHEETKEQRDRIEADIRGLLEPGDLITYQRIRGSGHVIMYLGDGMYTDCTTNGAPNSYDYVNHKNNFYSHGLWIQNLDRLFELDNDEKLSTSSMFCALTKRVSISRPLNIVGEPLPQAMLRVGAARGLWCAVENSVPGVRQTAPGSTVEYRVIVRNQTGEAKTAEIRLQAPAGAALESESTHIVTLSGGEEICVPFVVKVDAENTAAYLDGPAVTVNGLEVYAHRVLLGSVLTEEQTEAVCACVRDAMREGDTALAAAAKAYGTLGVTMEPLESSYAIRCFFLHDSTKGDVLSRRPQQPCRDLAVYSAFGGVGVITPEMGSLPMGPRMTHISRADLLPGDLIVCLDDGFGQASCSCFYDGESLAGSFAAGEACRTLRDGELDAFIDSLLGRYAFLVLRPSLGLSYS